MGWIGIAGPTDGRFAEKGFAGSGQSLCPGPLLARGTILLETRLSPEARPQTLLAFGGSAPWHDIFALRSLPGGGFAVIEGQGDALTHAAAPLTLDGRTEVVRLSYAWDAPRRWGCLAVERPGKGQTTRVPVADPHPLPLATLRGALTDTRQRETAGDVTFFAVSTEVEPVGPLPGLTDPIPVTTTEGPKPAARLRRGDTVLTDRGEWVPVLRTAERTVPACGSFRPVRLRAPYFGLERDIVISPQQRVVVTGTDVEYLFGREAVLVPAGHLANGIAAVQAQGPDLVTYRDVLLPEHAAVMAAGCPVESLYIGRLRRRPEDLAQSVLSSCDRNRLPEHATTAYPVLRPYEAVTLAMCHAA
jgi:hypothetical protein